MKKAKKDPESCSCLNFKMSANQIKDLIKYPDLELISETYLWWYNKLHKNIVAMYKPKKAMEIAVLNNDTKAYLAAQKEYKAQIKIYRNLFSKKTLAKAKMPEDKLAKLRKKKKEADRRKRASKKKKRRK